MRSGTTVPCAGNLPVRLDDPEWVWFIDRGTVNIFVVEFQDGLERAAPQHLLQRESGGLLPAVTPDPGNDGEGTSLSLLAKGLPGTLLKRLPASALSEVHPAELAEQIDTWLRAFTDTLSRFADRLPHPTALAEPGVTVTQGPCVLSVRRDVVWVSGLPRGAGMYMGIVDPSEAAAARGLEGAAMPLTRASWLTVFDEATLAGQSTRTLVAEGTVQSALAAFHGVAFALERLNRRLAVVDEANLERARTMSRHTAEVAARQRLYNVYDRPLEQDARVRTRPWRTPWTSLAATRESSSRCRTFRTDGCSVRPRRHPGCVRRRARRVRFPDEGKWWRGEGKALLAFRAEDGRPVALLPGKLGGYREIDPVSKRGVRVTGGTGAHAARRCLDVLSAATVGEAKPADLWRSALHGSAGNVTRLVLTGIPAA